MRAWLFSLLLLSGCVHGALPTQAAPASGNQMYMINEMNRLEPMLKMGKFYAVFTAPPGGQNYAGWAPCVLDRSDSPTWTVYFNEVYIESLDPSKYGYMSELVAHEMCHHWVHKAKGICGVEQMANTCAANLLLWGRPE